jgi:predicted O-methyltransferase YrrM
MNKNLICELPKEVSKLLSTERVQGKSGKDFKVGHSTLNNLRVLNLIFREHKPEKTMEVGLLFGASALLFSSLHNELGRSGIRQHIALDPYQDHCWDDVGLLEIEKAGLSDWFELRRSFSSIEMPRMVHAGERFGMIYVDGSHIFENVFIDAYYGSRLLEKDGIILFDDSSDKHVAKVIKFIRKNCAHALLEINLAHYYSQGKARLKYRAGRLIGKCQLTAFRLIGQIDRPWNAKFFEF